MKAADISRTTGEEKTIHIINIRLYNIYTCTYVFITVRTWVGVQFVNFSNF